MGHVTCDVTKHVSWFGVMETTPTKMLYAFLGLSPSDNYELALTPGPSFVFKEILRKIGHVT